MGDENLTRIIDFHEWCSQCTNKDCLENEEPCYSCLNEPARLETSTPVNFEKK